MFGKGAGILSLMLVSLVVLASCQKSTSDEVDAAVGNLKQELDASLSQPDAGEMPGSGAVDGGTGSSLPDASSPPDLPDASPFSMDAGQR